MPIDPRQFALSPDQRRSEALAEHNMRLDILARRPSVSSGTATGGPPTGAAGGDLAGEYPNPTIKDSVSLLGSPTSTTPSTADQSQRIATTAFVKAQGYAPVASPTFTGNVTVPSASRVGASDDYSIKFAQAADGGYVSIRSNGSIYANLDVGNNDADSRFFKITKNAYDASATDVFTVSESGLVTATGNINTTGIFQRNGTQIASSDLSDGANIAHINATEAISGAWTFDQTIRVLSGSPYRGFQTDYSSDTVGTAYVYLRRSRGTVAAPTAVLAGDDLGSIGFRGHVTAWNSQDSARITGVAASNHTSTSTAGELRFATTPEGSVGGSSERLRIDSAGLLWIGAGSGLDTNLYRASASVMHTNANFRSEGYIVAYNSNANQVTLGRTASGVAGPGITFGSTQDVNIYRGGTTRLKTDATHFITPGYGAVVAASVTNTVLNVSTVGTEYPVFQTPVPLVWHDLFAFSLIVAPTFETSADGTTWVAGTLDTGMFAQQDLRGTQVVDGVATTRARWTWDSNSFQYASGQWLVIGFPYAGATPPNKTVTFETSLDGITWTTRHTSTNNTQNGGGPGYFYVNSWSGDTKLRLTIQSTNALPVRVSSIRMYTARKGDQGRGKEFEFPYTWDGERRMAIGGGTIQTGSQLTIGTNTSASIHFGTDTNLYRASADTLRTDDALTVGATLQAVGALSEAFKVVGTNTKFNVNTTSSLVELVNSSSLRIYSGSYTGQVGSWDGVSGNLNASGSITARNGVAGSVIVGADANGSLSLGRLTADPGAQTPYLDFNYAPAGTWAAQDYNFRVINAADGRLDFSARKQGSAGANTRMQISHDAGITFPGAVDAANALIIGGDTNLYRVGTDALRTDDALQVGGNLDAYGRIGVDRTSGGSTAYQTWITGNTQVPFHILASGEIRWGSGTAAYDARVYRSGVATLAFDTRVHILRPASSDLAYSATVTGDTNSRFYILSDGRINWGSGTAGVDTTLYRTGTDHLQTDDRFTLNLASSTTTGLGHQVNGDSHPRLWIRADGMVNWGTGSALADTTLYRNGVAILRTGGEFRADGRLVASYGNAGAEVTIGSSNNQIVFGTDTNLYRSTTNTLKTDGALIVTGISGGVGLTITQGTVTLPSSSLNASVLQDGTITANKIGFVWNGGNIVPNATFGTGVVGGSLADWTGYGATRAVDETIKVGVWNSAKLTSTVTASDFTITTVNSTDNPIPALPGKNYVASAFIRPTIVGREYRVLLYFLDSAGAIVATVVPVYRTDLPVGEWTRLYAAGVAPATAVQARIYAQQGATGTLAGDVVYVGAPQVEQTELSQPTPFGPRAAEILPGTIQANMLRVGIISADYLTDVLTITSKRLETASGNTSARITIEGNASGIEGKRGIFGYMVNPTPTNPAIKRWELTEGGLSLFDTAGARKVSLSDTGGLSTSSGTSGARATLDGGGLIGYDTGGARSVTVDSGSGKFVAGGTLTGSTWSGERVELDRLAMRFYDSGGTQGLTTTGGGLVTSTSTTTPRVGFDANGVWVTDANNVKVAQFKGGAGGLDLTSATSASAPAERKVRFLRPSDNLPVAELYAYSATEDYTMLKALGRNTGGVVFVNAEKVGGTAADTSGLTIYAAAMGVDPLNFVDVQAGPVTKRLLKHDGTSDWALLASSPVFTGSTLKAGGTSNTMLGAHPTYGAGYSAFWREGNDYAILSSAADLFLNAPALGGNVYVRRGNANSKTLYNSTGGSDWAFNDNSNAAPPAARAVKSANQDIGNAATTAITFDAADAFDTGNLHDTTAGQNHKLTAATAGLYLVWGQIAYNPAAASGTVALWIQLSGSGARTGYVEQAWQNSGSAGTILQVAALVRMTAGQWVELVTYQATGATRTIDEGGTHFAMVKLGA